MNLKSVSKFVLTLAVAALTGSTGTIKAQGYQDGVDNFNADRFDEAKEILTNTLGNANTDKAVANFYLGQIAYRNNDMASAAASFEAGRNANPEYPYNLVGLGQLALKQGDKKAAEVYFKDAIKLAKKDNAIYAAIARAYFNVDPTLYADDIQKNINKGLEKSKNSEPDIYVLQGDMNPNPGEAAALYEMAIEQSKSAGQVNREAYVKYANKYFRQNPRFAIKKLEEFNEADPESALAQRELAEKYYENNQFGSACNQYGKYMANPNHFQKDEQRYAGLLFSAERFDESLDVANKVLAKDPDNEYMYRVIMLNKNALKDFSGAEAAGRKLFAKPGVKLIANDYILFANALSDQNKHDEAVAVYEQALELNPDQVDLMPRLSDALDRAGQQDRAVSVMKTYLDGGNGSTTDLYNMARRYDSLARTLPEGSDERKAAAIEGLKYINMCLEKVPDNFNLYRTKGQLILAANDNTPNAEMAQAYEKMIELLLADPSNADKYSSSLRAAYYLLGVYYLPIDGMKDKGLDYLNKYLTLNPEDETVRNIVNKATAE